MSTLEGKRAIVTGAASGIGRGISQLFVERGAQVAMVDVNDEAVAKAAAEIGDKTIGIACDVTSATQVEAAVDRAVSEFGGLDVVVNSAGVDHLPQPLIEHNEAEFDKVLAVNLKGVFLGTKYGGKALADSGGGVIINIGSVAGFGGVPQKAAYACSKAGVITLTQGAALELRSMDIRANVICPGFVRTPMVMDNLEEFKKITGATVDEMATQLQGRIAEPSDIAAAAAFLASDEASLITGVVFPIDGGISAKVV